MISHPQALLYGGMALRALAQGCSWTGSMIMVCRIDGIHIY